MAKKSRPKKSASKSVAKKKPTTSKIGMVGKAVTVAQSVGGMMGLGGGKAKATGKRRSKKSALWYAKEVQRLRLKRKYIKEKMRI